MMVNLRLYLAQRISALIMAPLVIGHLIVMIYAVREGLDADEILSRTRGSIFWGGFYGLFVVAVSIHAAMGLRTVIHEYLQMTGPLLNAIALLIGLALLGLGGRAIIAVVM